MFRAELSGFLRDLAARRSMIQQKTSELGAEHAEVLRIRENYVNALIVDNQISEAKAECQSIIQIRERLFGPDHGSLISCRQRLANCLNIERKYDQAEIQLRAVLKTQERFDGRTTRATLSCAYQLAYCLMQQGKREEALPYAQRAADGYRKLFGTNDEMTYDAERFLEDLQRKK